MELTAGPADGPVQVTQSLVLNQALHRVQEATGRMAQEHKDLHSTVSKVGKTIDRVTKYCQVVLMSFTLFSMLVF